jgi:glycosyltransferase involved in cell wall biosynthesis
MSEPNLSVVVIGRNEGERLRRCIDTLVQQTGQIVYVDSASTDGSVQMARSRGVHVLDLDMARPFSAARARNEGYAVMRRHFPDAQYVQFVDGDCDVDPGWLEAGVRLLESRSDVAAVYGTLDERNPEGSVYNYHAHMTWNPPEEGEVEFFGGNFMIRVAAFDAAKGFREDVIDSEDHELAIRLRQNGGKVWYLKRRMALHDLAIFEFGRWWVRTKRGGYGNGQIITLHGDAPGRPHRRDWNKSWIWGLALPAFTLASVWAVGWMGLLPLGLYGLSFLKMYLSKREDGGGHAGFAAISVLHKIAQMTGQVKFLVDKAMGRGPRIIEYK